MPGTSLGIARLREAPGSNVAGSFAALPPAVRAYARRPELLVITKSTSRSTVHRPGFLDYVGVKRFDAAGDVCGEHRFLGLFTHTAYSANPADIPLLRHKTANVVRRANLPAGRPRREAADQHPRQLSARRALPDLRGRARCARRPASCISATGSAFASSSAAIRSSASSPASSTRRASTTRPGAAEVAGDPAAGAQGPELRLQRAPVGIVAGARDDHRAHDTRRCPARRRTRARGAARSRGAPLGRRAQGGAHRRAGRGARQCVVPAIRRRVSRRLPRGHRSAQRGARHRDDGSADRRRARSGCRSTGRSKPRRTRCASSCSAWATRSRCPTACRCSSGWG